MLSLQNSKIYTAGQPVDPNGGEGVEERWIRTNVMWNCIKIDPSGRALTVYIAERREILFSIGHLIECWREKR